MSSVDDEKICVPSSFSERKSRNRAETDAAKIQSIDEKSMQAFEDDSFMDSINWSAVSSKSMFSKDQVVFSPGIRPATFHDQRELSKEHSPTRSPIASAPTPVSGTFETNMGSSDTYHRYPMTKITDALYLGNDDDACDEAALKKANITHVLSMIARKWSYKPRGWLNWRREGIKRKCVPMRDDGNSDVAKLLEEKGLWNFILDSQKRRKKLLIHCQMGMNRSPTIVMGFLMKHNHITFYKAWRLVKQKRVIVQPHEKYIKQLRAWNMYLHGSYSTPSDFLKMRVSEKGISVLHENADTKRMNDVLVASTKILQDQSTNNMPMTWESGLETGSPKAEKSATMGESTNLLSNTFSDSELKLTLDSISLKVE